MGNEVSKVKNPLAPSRWAYLKNLHPAAPVMIHKSCDAYMVRDPREAMTGVAMPVIPYVQRPGLTYDVGRNKAKRETKAARQLRQRGQA